MNAGYEYHAARGFRGINVGRARSGSHAFESKQERTDEVIAVVGEYVRDEFGNGTKGGMEATYEGLNMRITVTVEPMEASDD